MERLSSSMEQQDQHQEQQQELRTRGLSQTEIAHELQVLKASISSDVQYLRKQAKETIESKNILFISKIRYDILCKQLQRYHVR
jgi:transcriptional regulator